MSGKNVKSILVYEEDWKYISQLCIDRNEDGRLADTVSFIIAESKKVPGLLIVIRAYEEAST